MAKYARPDGRSYGQLRPIRIKVGVAKFAEGSAYIEYGDKQVLCTASIEERVPRHLENKEQGWDTAEDARLPRATAARNQRESRAGRTGARTRALQRRGG